MLRNKAFFCTLLLNILVITCFGQPPITVSQPQYFKTYIKVKDSISLNGYNINYFDNDSALSANSPDRIPTQQAVKKFILNSGGVVFPSYAISSSPSVGDHPTNMAEFIALFYKGHAEPLSITTQPADATYNLVDAIPVNLLAAGGKSPVTYQWQFAAPGSTDFNNLSGETANNISVSHLGNYRCIVIDAATPTPASITSRTAVITRTLQITAQPLANQTVNVGGYFALNFTAVGGINPATLSIYKGSDIYVQPFPFTIGSYSGSYGPVQLSDAGSYTLRVIDSNGVTVNTTASVVTVNAQNQLATPSPTASEITAHGFKLTWPAITNATQYPLDVSLTSDFLNIIANSTPNNPEFTVVNGNPNTLYYFRVKAQDGNGVYPESAYGTGNVTTASATLPVDVFYSTNQLYTNSTTAPVLTGLSSVALTFIHNGTISTNLPQAFTNKFVVFRVPLNEPIPTSFNNGTNTFVGDAIPGSGVLVVVRPATADGYMYIMSNTLELQFDYTQPINILH